MVETALEKVYGTRTLTRISGGYLQMSVPKDVVDDDRFGLEPGEEVAVRGVIANGEAYLKIEGVDDE